MNLSDTIVACASAPGASARGLVRVSGSETWPIVESISAASHRPIDRQRGVAAHRLVQEWPCLLLRFPQPNSYTGQDTIELALPGNPALLARVVSLAIAAGARQAEAGEFTARAWLNGRMTLTQAEGVAAMISAASDAQLRAAQVLMSNRLGRVAAELCEQLARALALVEAGIDFTEEEDVVAIAPDDLASRLDSISRIIDETLDRAVGSESLSALPTVVLVGPPNAGKSTLYNALLGRRRAVVSEIRGTTRDVLVEPMHLDPTDPLSPEVLLVDMAGLDESSAGLNPLMQAAARRAIERADLLVELEPVLDNQHAAPAYAGATAGEQSRAPRIRVRSKGDLDAAPLERADDDASPKLRLSVRTGEGVAELRRRIGDALVSRVASLGADTMALVPRHEQCLREAREHLGAARILLGAQASMGGGTRSTALRDPELLAASMRQALDALGQIAGAVSPDDVLGRIFAGFCIGK